MTNQTCKAKIAYGKIEVDIYFDYTPAQPECGEGANAEIDKVLVLNDGGYPMGDIADILSEDSLDWLQKKCFEAMGDE